MTINPMINKAVDSLFLRLGQPAEHNGKTVPIFRDGNWAF